MIQVPVGDVDAQAAAPLLTPREIAAHAAFPVEKRRAEWLAGTLAAKAAIRGLRGPVPWSEIEVLNGPDRARLVHLPPGVPVTAVTLSHAAGVAVADAFDPAIERVGVDVEVIQPRPASFLEEAFAPSERDALAADPTATTLAWCAKEAVLKSLGTGLSVDLHAVTVRLHPDGAVTVALEQALEERRRLLRGGPLRARAWVAAGRAYARAAFPVATG